MPVSIETTANTLTDLDLFTEISYGTVTPNFDKLDVYVDATQLGASKMIWRLYATTSGLRSPIAVVGPIASDFPMRIIAGLGMISATTYELTGELVDSIVYPVLPPVAPVVIAGLAGYDSLINSAPLTSVSSHKLIYGGSVTFGTIGAYYPKFQVELDLTGAGPKCSSNWILYAIVTGAGGTITAPVAQQSYNYTSEQPAKLIILQASSIGASSYRLDGIGIDPNLVPATPAVSAALTGFAETVDGTGGAPVTLYYQTVQDAGVAKPQQSVINFIGAAVADDALNNRTNVTIPGGGITQLTQDVLAGPGAGSQVASVVEATGEVTGPGPGVLGWWFPIKAGSIGLCNSPDGSAVSIYRLPGPLGTNPFSAYTVLNADGGDVSLGRGGVVAQANNTSIYAEVSVAIYGRSTRLVRKTRASANNDSQSLWQVSQPSQFVAAEVYGGGAAFNCDTGLLATTLIECNFAGGGAGTINLPSNNAGRVLHIADQSSTITVLAPLTLQPDAGTSVGGGAVGAPLVITTTGWAQKLVLNSAGNNWMIF
jgi:hypothetical protein